MEGLRAQAKKRFEDQEFRNNEALSTLEIPLISISKFSIATKFGQAYLPWNTTKGKDLCNKINRPITDAVTKENAAATLKLVKFDRDVDGTILIDRDLFTDIFQDFGFDSYWLHLVQCSVYGLFVKKMNSSLSTFYFHSVLYTLLWSYNVDKRCTKVIIILRKTETRSHQPSLFSTLLQLMDQHKSLIDDSRFCSFLSAIQLIHWIEDSVHENLRRIRSVEAATEHGAWRIPGGLGKFPGPNELVDRSKAMGLALTALANVTRHASIAKTLLNDLVSKHHSASSQSLTSQSFMTQSTAPQSNSATHIMPSNTITTSSSIVDEISEAVVFLTSQVDFGELEAAYLQERARTQHSVIFNLLTRHDAESSKNIAKAALKDSSSMKTIAIMTMIFLPPTFFATLFAMPLLKWDSPTVIRPNFAIYWAFSLISTALVFFVWDLKSNSGRLFGKCWKRKRPEKEHEFGEIL